MIKRERMPELGDFIRVVLPDGGLVFGRILRDPLIAFYDMKTDSTPSLDEIESAGVLFKIWVMNKAVSSGRWSVIGNKELRPDLLVEPRFFKQDPISKKFYIHGSKTADEPVSPEECVGLERAAVWSAEHVEDRLMDHFNGVECRWVRPALSHTR